MKGSWIVDWVRTLLTIAFIRYLRRGEYIGKETVSAGNRSVEVYKFRSGSAVPAQNTLWNTIIWDESSLGGATEKEKELVLEHELSHRERNAIYRGLYIGGISMFVGGLFILLYVTPLELLNGGSAGELIEPAGTALTMILGFILLWRIEETWADYDALCALGEDKFLTAYETFRDGGDPSVVLRLLGKVVYTEPENTQRLYRKLNGSD